VSRGKQKVSGEGIPWAFVLAETAAAIGIKRKKGWGNTPPSI